MYLKAIWKRQVFLSPQMKLLGRMGMKHCHQMHRTSFPNFFAKTPWREWEQVGAYANESTTRSKKELAVAKKVAKLFVHC